MLFFYNSTIPQFPQFPSFFFFAQRVPGFARRGGVHGRHTGDGGGDNSDAFPRWEGETTDTDKDGVGDNTDVFPDDPFESADSDGDGVGDNADFRPYDKDVQSESDLESFPIITLVAAGIVSIFALVIFQQKVLSKPSKSKKAGKKSGGRKGSKGKRKLFSKDEINDRAA